MDMEKLNNMDNEIVQAEDKPGGGGGEGGSRTSRCPKKGTLPHGRPGNFWTRMTLGVYKRK